MGRGESEDTLMSDVTGLRAVWWLYKRGMWGYLEDFGLKRENVEPALLRFDQENVVKNRLTTPQARKLARRIPELQEASVELRLTYALKMYDETIKQAGRKRPTRKKRKDKKVTEDKSVLPRMRYYAAQLTTFDEAEEVAKEHADAIVQAGGSINVGRDFSGDGATLLVSLPDGPNLDELLPNRATWQEMAFYAAAAVEDMGVPSDPEAD